LTSKLVSISKRQHILICSYFLNFFQNYLKFFMNFTKMVEKDLPYALRKHTAKKNHCRASHWQCTAKTPVHHASRNRPHPQRTQKNTPPGRPGPCRTPCPTLVDLGRPRAPINGSRRSVGRIKAASPPNPSHSSHPLPPFASSDGGQGAHIGAPGRTLSPDYRSSLPRS
jgi:hypothetical protein